MHVAAGVSSTVPVDTCTHDAVTVEGESDEMSSVCPAACVVAAAAAAASINGASAFAANVEIRFAGGNWLPIIGVGVVSLVRLLSPRWHRHVWFRVRFL